MKRKEFLALASLLPLINARRPPPVGRKARLGTKIYDKTCNDTSELMKDVIERDTGYRPGCAGVTRLEARSDAYRAVVWAEGEGRGVRREVFVSGVEVAATRGSEIGHQLSLATREVGRDLACALGKARVV